MSGSSTTAAPDPPAPTGSGADTTGSPQDLLGSFRVRSWFAWGASRDLPPTLRADPGLRRRVPELLRLPGAGTQLALRDSWPRHPAAPTDPLPTRQRWGGALGELCAHGVLDRDEVLGAVLDSLLLGGSHEHVAGLRTVHDDLLPGIEDAVAQRVRYAALLTQGDGVVAATAQRLLRRAGGGLDVDDVLSWSRGALARSEKRLVLGQLRWLRDLAAEHPDRADDLARTVQVALADARLDVAEAALDLLLGLAPRLGSSREELARAVADLPEVLRRRAAPALLGSAASASTPSASTPSVVQGPRPEASGTGFEPVADLGALAGAVARYLQTGDVDRGEVVLDGLAGLAAADPEATARSLAPFRGALGLGRRTRRARTAHSLATGVWHLLRDLVRHDPECWSAAALAGAEGREGGPDPSGCLMWRAAEVLEAIGRGECRRLLALPAGTSGRCDPARVLRQLRADATSGVVEGRWTADLQQTALRLPDVLPDGWVEEVEAVGTPAALALLGLHRSLPWQVEVTVTWRPATMVLYGRTVDDPLAGSPVVTVLQPDGLPALAARAMAPWSGYGDADAVRWAAPRYRELVAAQLVEPLEELLRPQLVPGVVEALGHLPGNGGPSGPATALALAYASANEDLGVRTAAADAVGLLAETSQLDGPSAGPWWSRVLVLPRVPLTRAVATLREASREPAAQRAVFELLAGMLPGLLASGRRGLHEPLALAAELAAACGASGTVAVLELVAVPGTSRLATEARRLDDVLGRR